MEYKSEKLRIILYNLDWIKILDRAVKHRPSSWNFGNYNHPVIEWRNASDGVFMALIKELENKKILEEKAI